MKQGGATGRVCTPRLTQEIIQKQLEGNKSYELRTAYSQEKIMKRKESKHLHFFTPLPPDTFHVAAYHFERSPEKVRGMRSDALAQCLSFANVQAGGKYLIVDGIGGLLTGAVLERLGGAGSVLLIHDADSPPALELMPLFNLTPAHTQGILKTLHWAATEHAWTLRKCYILIQASHMSEELAKVYETERERQRARKKREGIENFIASRQQFFDGEFDAALVASPYEPYSIIHRLVPYLAGSSNVVVHSPHLQVGDKATDAATCRSTGTHESKSCLYQCIRNRALATSLPGSSAAHASGHDDVRQCRLHFAWRAHLRYLHIVIRSLLTLDVTAQMHRPRQKADTMSFPLLPSLVQTPSVRPSFSTDISH